MKNYEENREAKPALEMSHKIVNKELMAKERSGNLNKGSLKIAVRPGHLAGLVGGGGGAGGGGEGDASEGEEGLLLPGAIRPRAATADPRVDFEEMAKVASKKPLAPQRSFSLEPETEAEGERKKKLEEEEGNRRKSFFGGVNFKGVVVNGGESPEKESDQKWKCNPIAE